MSEPKCVADVHLRRPARILRLLEFDTLHSQTLTDCEFVQRARTEERIVLARARQVLKHRAVARGHWARSINSAARAREVVRRFGPTPRANPFSRCIAFTGRIRPVNKDEVADRVPARTATWLDEYRKCSTCRRLYRSGSHLGRLHTIVGAALAAPSSG